MTGAWMICRSGNGTQAGRFPQKMPEVPIPVFPCLTLTFRNTI